MYIYISIKILTFISFKVCLIFMISLLGKGTPLKIQMWSNKTYSIIKFDWLIRPLCEIEDIVMSGMPGI